VGKCSGTLFRMSDDPRADLRRATKKYEQYLKVREEVERAIVAALKAGVPQTEVTTLSPFTERYVRTIARNNGIEPAPPGPKKRQRRASSPG
jgi:hypothetical protein